MQTPEISEENSAGEKKNDCSGREKKPVATDTRPSSSTRDYKFSRFGDVKIYELRKAREGSKEHQFPQIVFVGDARFTLNTIMIKLECACDIKVYEKSGLTLDKIESFLSAQADIDFTQRTLLICSVGAFDALPLDEGYQDGTCDIVQKGKDVKTTLCKLFSQNSLVLFLPVLPVDFTHKLCGHSYAQCMDDKRKETIKWGFHQICQFNKFLHSSAPRVIQENMGKFHMYSFQSFIGYTQTNMGDGIQLNETASNYLSRMVGNCVKLIKQSRYENVIFVGDMRLEDIAKACPDWEDNSWGIKLLCGFNYKLSSMTKGSSVIKELRGLKGSLVVFMLGMSDLYEFYFSVCQGCGRNVKFPVVKTFAQPLSFLFSQIYTDMYKAERALRDATLGSCEVMFSMCYPLDIVSCQQYWIDDHLKICNNVNIVKPLSSSPNAVKRMTEDSARLIEIVNKMSALHSIKNNIMSWDPLPLIYGENYTKRSSLESKVADVFREGVNFTPDKFQSVAEQLFTNVQQLNLFSGSRRIKWMAVNEVVSLDDLTSDRYPQALHSNSTNMNFSQKITSSDGMIPKAFLSPNRKPLLPSPYNSSCSIPNWAPSTPPYIPGTQYMPSSNGVQSVDAYPNSYLVFHGDRCYYTSIPVGGYSTQQAFNSLPAFHYSSNPSAAQNSHQQYMGGLQQNNSGNVSGSGYQLSGSNCSEGYYSAYSTPENDQYRMNPSTCTSSAPSHVNNDSVLPIVQHESGSSSSVTSGQNFMSSESKVCDEAKAAWNAMQHQDIESCNTPSRKEVKGDKTPLSELGTPDTPSVPQLPKSKENVETYEMSLQESRKGEAVSKVQPPEVTEEEKTHKTSHQNIVRRMEVYESPVINLKERIEERKTLSTESENMEVTRKSSLNMKTYNTTTLLYELGERNGKSQSYLSILKQNNISELTLKYQRKDGRSFTSSEKRLEKENNDFNENRETREKRGTSSNCEKRNPSFSRQRSDTENMYNNQEGHIPKSSESDYLPCNRHAKRSKLHNEELSLSSSSSDERALSYPELPRRKSSREDRRCSSQAQKRLKREYEEHDAHREKRQNKGTADGFQKINSEHCSYEEELDIWKKYFSKAHAESYSVNSRSEKALKVLDGKVIKSSNSCTARTKSVLKSAVDDRNLQETSKNAVINYLSKFKANELSLSTDLETALDDYVKETLHCLKELGNRAEDMGHSRESNIPYNQTLSAMALETKSVCSNLPFSSSKSSQVEMSSVQEVCQLPIGKANEIIDILEALRNFGDDLGALNAPLKVIYEKTLKLQAENLDVSRILQEDDSLTFLFLVLDKLKEINNSPDQSMVQKLILEEASERLSTLLKNIP